MARRRDGDKFKFWENSILVLRGPVKAEGLVRFQFINTVCDYSECLYRERRSFSLSCFSESKALLLPPILVVYKGLRRFSFGLS